MKYVTSLWKEALSFVLLFLIISTAIAFRTPQTKAVVLALTVNTTTDASDIVIGDGKCDSDASTVGDQCTLRSAVEEANGTTGTDLVIVNFNIPGEGVHTITPQTALPAVTRTSITIDGSTQPGSSCGDLWAGNAPIWNVKIDGNGANFDGFTIAGGNSVVKGIDVDGFVNGISISGQNNQQIVCNDLHHSSHAGLNISSSNNVTVGGSSAGQGNLISGNKVYGIYASGNSNSITIQGNFMGTDVTGMWSDANGERVPNGYGQAIEILDGSNQLIGGAILGSGNLIAGNQGDIRLYTNVVDSKIVGNTIGLNRLGTKALIYDPSTGTGGVNVAGLRITIGGSNANERNVIAAGHAPVYIHPDARSVTVENNYIGLNSAGTAVVNHLDGAGITDRGTNSIIRGNVVAGATGDNTASGIDLNGTSGFVENNLVGTDAIGNSSNSSFTNNVGMLVGGGNYTIHNNVIGNSAVEVDFGDGMLHKAGAGILFIGGSNNTVTENNIGISRDKQTAIPNQYGIVILNGSTLNDSTNNPDISGSNNIIINNTIANNVYGGIVFNALFGPVAGNSFLGNSIYDNGGVGIDLSKSIGLLFTDGITHNGARDAGSSNFIYYPVISRALGLPTRTIVFAKFQGAPSQDLRIEFFWSPSGTNRQGKVFLGFKNITTNRRGTKSFIARDLLPIKATGVVTATATDKAGNTSEFSAEIVPRMRQPLAPVEEATLEKEFMAQEQK